MSYIVVPPILKMSLTRYILTIPDWHPATTNQLLRSVRLRIRLKKNDREMVCGYSLQANIPNASVRRRVSLQLTLAPRQRAADPDAYWKSLLDALVRAGLLVDDNRTWCELGSVEFTRGSARATTIMLEDIP